MGLAPPQVPLVAAGAKQVRVCGGRGRGVPHGLVEGGRLGCFVMRWGGCAPP